MNKNEFLRILRESLEMSLEQDAINAQLDYYDKYISGEMKNGKTEKEVIEELGDPRLIAKTIRTVNTGERTNKSSSNQNNYNNEYWSQGESYNDRERASGNGRFKSYYSSNSVIGCTIAFLVFFIIVYGILRMFGNIAYSVGNFAFSGPFGFIIVCGILYLLFGGRRK